MTYSSIWVTDVVNGVNHYEANQRIRQMFFEKISPKPNWKAEINCWIDEKDFEDCNQAAIFFSGGELSRMVKKGNKVLVTGKGYYLNVGA